MEVEVKNTNFTKLNKYNLNIKKIVISYQLHLQTDQWLHLNQFQATLHTQYFNVCHFTRNLAKFILILAFI